MPKRDADATTYRFRLSAATSFIEHRGSQYLMRVTFVTLARLVSPPLPTPIPVHVSSCARVS